MAFFYCIRKNCLNTVAKCGLENSKMAILCRKMLAFICIICHDTQDQKFTRNFLLRNVKHKKGKLTSTIGEKFI